MRYPASVWKNPIHFVAFGFGAGTLPLMPGTWGTLVAIPIYLGLSQFSLMTYCLVTLLMAVVGVWLCYETGKATKVHDHPGIVWDEIVGYLVTMIAVPNAWWAIAAGFVLFRLFDVVKPWPISWCQKNIKGGTGVMLDDILAAIPCLIILHLVARHVS